MKYNLLILFLLLFFNSQAQKFYDAKILLKNGKVIEGEATMPSNKILDKSIRHKIGFSNKSEKIKNNDISKIFYTLKNGNQYLFERTNLSLIDKDFDPKSSKTMGGSHWLMLNYSSEAIKVYIGALYYEVDENGVMVSKSDTGSPFWPEIYFLVQRPGEEYPGVLGQETFGSTIKRDESKFREIASIYFADKPEVVKAIQEMSYKSHQIISLAQYYSRFFNQ